MYCSQRVTKLINFLGSPHRMTVIIWRFSITAEVESEPLDVRSDGDIQISINKPSK